MTPRATVVVPTHDHGPTLLRSVPSALSQTIPDLEVFLIGDGASEETREIAIELCRSDERVRLFDYPKGPRHGEILRHGALQEARGEIVCYLSDDDLWLPDHVATMASLLLETDFAHTYPVRIQPDGTIGDWNVDLAVHWFRRAVLAGRTSSRCRAVATRWTRTGGFPRAGGPLLREHRPTCTCGSSSSSSPGAVRPAVRGQPCSTSLPPTGSGGRTKTRSPSSTPGPPGWVTRPFGPISTLRSWTSPSGAWPGTGRASKTIARPWPPLGRTSRV